MNTLANKISEAMATEVWFDSLMLHIRLIDGREISVPLDWFPRIRDATDKQRKNWRLIGRVIGIHREAIDEDISVSSLLYKK